MHHGIAVVKPVAELTAGRLAGWMAEFARQIALAEPLLTELDAAIGDGDHGINMHRGMQAALTVSPRLSEDARDYLKQVAMKLICTVGGASGPLYGTFLLRMSQSLPSDGPIDRAAWAAGIGAGIDGVRIRGRASAGDKTMLDALEPALQAFEAADARPWAAAAEAAAAGRDATVPLVARRGRASYLGERSAGHADPGATSAALLIAAAARTLA